MKASIGDHIVIVSNRIDVPPRDGRILEVRGADGEPPYLVEWSHNKHQGLLFPGTDAHIQHQGEPPEPSPTPGSARTWRVELNLFEVGDETTARAVLVADWPGMETVGTARRNPKDPDVRQIGDEVAAARALRRLADRLLGAAADDIGAVEGHRVELRR